MMAVSKGHGDLVQLLLDSGAKLNVKNVSEQLIFVRSYHSLMIYLRIIKYNTVGEQNDCLRLR